MTASEGEQQGLSETSVHTWAFERALSQSGTPKVVVLRNRPTKVHETPDFAERMASAMPHNARCPRTLPDGGSSGVGSLQVV
jgi:hypothetical protein